MLGEERERLCERVGEDRLATEIRNKTERTTVNFKDIESVIRKYYIQLNANKLDNLDLMGLK